ncbi:hypothetical protein JHK87_055385 [Glycine soja]|nr:hypothetical protein JHK87_055385 [Glycine soja]
MALAMVGEALISASVEILTKRIASREFRDFFSSRKLNISVLDELMKLLALNAVLNDAEEKQITDLAVKEWLEELKDAVLDAEDLLDEINTDALRCEVEDETKTSTTKDDKEKLLSMLLSDDDAMSNDIAVITVLGMGGLGKTTLVQSLYNDSEVQKHFDLTAWAWVSDDFNILKVTKKIVESFTSKDCHILKVIVTTRQQKVAQVTHTFPTYELQHLSDENCWQILARHAFGHEGYDKYPSLEKMGRKIARKCNGLPLAAKTLGGLLRPNVDAAEWNRTLNSNLWAHDDVLPALRISYFHLPAHLKRCSAYCSIFPKQSLLDRKELILLWMAEGFLQHNKEKAIESVGDDCFNELSSRSLIQKDSAIAEENFQMHDLIYDLARLVSGRSSCYFEGGEISRTVRHLSFLREMFDVSEKFEALCLCILSLSKYKNIIELPDSIGNLLHLWYLDLSYTSIESLSYETFMLYNLQTLILSNCEFLIQLPRPIGNLVNLRHLDISYTNFPEMATQICRLQYLRTLTVFIVGKQDGLSIRDLRKFPYLLGKLSILNLQNVVNPVDAFRANLKNKEQIEELMLEWGSNPQDPQIEKDVLNNLQPSTNLKKLNIKYYGGTSFPNWIGHSSFSNIIVLNVSQ